MLRLLLMLCLFAGLVAARAEARDLRVALGIIEAMPAAAAGMNDFDAEFAKAICQRIEARCTFVRVLFPDIIPGIEARKFEVGFGNFLRTPEREQRVAFSDPIRHSSSRLIASPATARRMTALLGRDFTPERLRNCRLGVVADSVQHRYLQQIASEQGLEIHAVGTLEEVFAELHAGKIDFALLPMLSAYSVMKRQPAPEFEFVGPPLMDHGLGGTVHIALPKDDEPLLRDINRGIAALRADGSYYRIVRRYFPFSLD